MSQCKVCSNEAKYKLHNNFTNKEDFFCDFHSRKYWRTRSDVTKKDKEPFEEYNKK